MKLFCKECGCEFQPASITDCELCPNCAAEHIRKTEEFLHTYNPNGEAMRRLDREFDLGSAVSDYFFIDTYPMFRKLLENKQVGEPLSDCLSRTIMQPWMRQDAFYLMDRSTIQGWIKKKGDYCYQQLWKEIRTVFLNGEKVQIVGFGTFEVKERLPRTGINPYTKKAMEIPATKRLSFASGKTLKALINK